MPSRSRKSRSYRRKHRGGTAYSGSNNLNPENYSSDSGASNYMLNNYGDLNTQLKNFDSDSSSNYIKTIGGRRRRMRKRTNRKRGGFIGEIVNQAIVPATLFGLSRRYQKNPHQSRHRKFSSRRR
jgi:hypothetical protein